jgi:hypothetical protein
MKYITRIDRKHSGYGWLVRYRGQAKWFPDARYGDQSKSQQAARFYLADLKKKNRPPQSSSGVPGIVKAYIQSGAKRLPCYVVNIKPLGIYKRFYPHRYNSDSEALHEAIAFRRQVERAQQQAGQNPEEGIL